MDGGKPFAEGVAELQAQYPEWSEAIAIYHTRWIEMMGGEIEGMADIVRRLKEAGYGVYGLTNWSSETFPLVKDKYAIFKQLDGMVVSGEEHLLKPDAAIYKCLLERYGLRAEESLFVDDNLANVEGARAVGMQGVQFKSAEELERTLKEEYGLEF